MVDVGPSGTTELMVVLWADRGWRYFLASAGSTEPGTSCQRLRWRQIVGGAVWVAVSVPQPAVAETYYACCVQNDRRNRDQQDDLRLDQKLGTQDWSQRVIISFLRVCIVDACLLQLGAWGPASLKQAAFYENLASGLLENTIETVGWQPLGPFSKSAGMRQAAGADPRASGAVGEAMPPPAYGVGVHLTPRSKRRPSPDGGESSLMAQRSCRLCKTNKSTLACSGCHGIEAAGNSYVCGPKTGRNCFATHLLDADDTAL